MRDAVDFAKLTVAGLKAVALACGSPTTGNKAQVSNYMIQKLQQRPKGAVRLVSIDLGLKNIGVCQALATPGQQVEVEKWSLKSLPEHINYSQPNFAHEARRLLHGVMMDSPNVVLVEKQRSRSAGSASVPNDILRVNVLEGMVHAILCTQWPTIYVESVEPKHVLGYWRSQLERELGGTALAVERLKKATPAQVYNASKKARLALVRKWIDKPQKAPFVFSPELELPTKRTKQDDLNDALVQAVTWQIWRDNSKIALNTDQNLRELAKSWSVDAELLTG
ncbi:Cruciform cutting endonuclease 1, mitochondrial [Wickerhamiella sorbophila]|uniref:Cruciform cutting endonuclease 1, mitochondrial n=1 Tax=Wickerhamiella sorbophila TaxID=45607 RepID=A0A2T0FEK8_9ASCO|nr:Cruciform cutting endonuclease 1, mitochondrial [Wickerhamiella sorbophila]PRT53397.1 Cruciform cutting endonuclease 1, mitochondrial [Wickerhamiella sorbophila]